MKPLLLDMDLTDLRQAVRAAGEKAFHCDQLADWVYKKGVTEPSRMTNVPDRLVEHFDILTGRPVRTVRSADGCTKVLLAFGDGAQVESVLIPNRKRATACLSTQAGCAMGCEFCASGLDGLDRNLTSGEIVEQILHLMRAGTHAITNVVFMGMGEPLANYEATVDAVRAVIDPARFGISARRVTISTIGLPDKIRRLAGEHLPVTLAISLHAPNDTIRARIMPMAARYPIEAVLDAARDYFSQTGREITLEYVLLAGINDTESCATELADLAQTLRCNINLIGYNPVASLPFRRPSQAAIQGFVKRLNRRGVNTHLRQSRGLDADAACGQLRRQEDQ